MEGLIKAVADVFAAIFGALGFVGKPRLRHAIHDDIQLLDQLGTHPSFGSTSWPYVALMNRTALNVGKLAGVDASGKKIQWGSVLWGSVMGLPLAFWTYSLNKHGFHWYSIFPGFFAFFFLVGTIGMIASPESTIEESDVDAGELEDAGVGQVAKVPGAQKSEA
jgi:hypothetical protein